MEVDRDDTDERQLRLDWMMDEFRKAQARRQAKVAERPGPPRNESGKAAAAPSEAPGLSRINDHPR